MPTTDSVIRTTISGKIFFMRKQMYQSHTHQHILQDTV
jgi:hypothetical protein